VQPSQHHRPSFLEETVSSSSAHSPRDETSPPPTASLEQLFPVPASAAGPSYEGMKRVHVHNTLNLLNACVFIFKRIIVHMTLYVEVYTNLVTAKTQYTCMYMYLERLKFL